jgi:hypothetical protein
MIALLHLRRIYSSYSPYSCAPVYLKPAGLCDGAAVFAVFTGNYQRAAARPPQES